jgi:hypothetical protein
MLYAKYFTASTLILLGLIQSAHCSLNVSTTLIDAFRGQCPNVITRHVQGSLGNIQSLRNVVMTIKEDSQCFGNSNLIEVLSNYERIYSEYEVFRNTRNSKDEIEASIAYYTNLLSDSSLTIEDITLINSNIFISQAELVSIESELTRFNSFSNDQALGASQVLTSVEGLLNTMGGSPACFEKKSSLLGGLLSQSLLATAAFTNPGTALALAAGGVIVGSVTNYIQNFRYNQALQFLDETELPTAIRCVSQALSDQYCDSAESTQLIDLYRHQFGRDGSSLEGLELLSKQMGHLSHWLQEVYAGSAITSHGDLVNREKPILQAELLEKITRYIQTYGTIRKRTFNDISNSKEKSEAIAIAISNLVSIMKSPTLTPTPPNPFGGGRDDGGIENPIFISRDMQLLPFSLFDSTLGNIPDCPSGGSSIPKCGSLLQYVRNKGIILTMSNWMISLENALKVVGDTLDQVNIERARTVSVDAYSVLVRARSDLRGETNAFQSLGLIIENAERIAIYLTEQGCLDDFSQCITVDGMISPQVTHRYNPQISNVRKTGKLARTILDLVKEAYMPRTMPNDSIPKVCQGSANFDVLVTDDILEKKSFQITSCITKILKLAERGNDVFFQKIRDMVGYEIEVRFASGEFDDDLSDVVYATRVDLVNSLLDSFNQGNQTVSLGEIYMGLETSMGLSQSTYDEFMKFFKNGVLASLNRNMSKGEKADLCFKVLPSLSDSDQQQLEKVYNFCSHTKMNFYSKGPTIKWSDNVERKESRVFLGRKKWKYHVKSSKRDTFCLVRNYNRKNLLIEEHRRRLKEDTEKYNINNN